MKDRTMICAQCGDQFVLPSDESLFPCVLAGLATLLPQELIRFQLSTLPDEDTTLFRYN